MEPATIQCVVSSRSSRGWPVRLVGSVLPHSDELKTWSHLYRKRRPLSSHQPPVGGGGDGGGVVSAERNRWVEDGNLERHQRRLQLRAQGAIRGDASRDERLLDIKFLRCLHDP